MKLKVAFFVVGFLEKYVSAYTCILKLSVVFNSSSRNINVYSSNSTVFVVYAINSFYALQNILDRIILRVLTCFYSKALVTHILERYDLTTYLLLC